MQVNSNAEQIFRWRIKLMACTLYGRRCSTDSLSSIIVPAFAVKLRAFTEWTGSKHWMFEYTRIFICFECQIFSSLKLQRERSAWHCKNVWLMSQHRQSVVSVCIFLCSLQSQCSGLFLLLGVGTEESRWDCRILMVTNLTRTILSIYQSTAK